jgi:hypothetical protein
MAQKDGLRFAGDVDIERVEIVSSSGRGVEVTNMIAEIQIFEDIFAPCVTGTVTITDSIDLVNVFPFIGEEKIILKIKTPAIPDKMKEATIHQQFYIYKMSDRKVLGDKNVFYILHFCSYELVSDANLKLSRSFEGKISDIAKKIMKDEIVKSDLPMDIEETKNSVKYISNYWSPYKNMNFLVERAISTSNVPNYVFFENRHGLNFVSLSGLFTKKDREQYTYDSFERVPKTHGSIQNPEATFSRFLDYTIETGFDYIERINNGMFGSKMISHDILTKKYSTQNISMFTNFEKEKHLNPYPVSTQDVLARYNSNIFNYPKYNSHMNGSGDDGVQNWLQRRVSLMAQAHAYRMTAEVPGRTDITVGEIVTVKIYKSSQTLKEDENESLIDNMFSGRYIISALNHRITREKHEIHMELLKDSLIVDPKTGKK